MCILKFVQQPKLSWFFTISSNAISNWMTTYIRPLMSRLWNEEQHANNLTYMITLIAHTKRERFASEPCIPLPLNLHPLAFRGSFMQVRYNYLSAHKACEHNVNTVTIHNGFQQK